MWSQRKASRHPEKTRAVREWPTPTSVGEVRSFLGLASYYRRYIPGFAAKSEPLRCLLQKNRQFEWTEQQQKAFTELKECLVNPPALAYPSFGPEAGEFILDTDASTEKGIGAVLSQKQSDGTERVIAYGSRSLQPPEQNFCATRLEMLALVEFIDHFRYYLLGRCFTARTDHHALKWLRSFKEPQGQVARWLERLQKYNFVVDHRPGRAHTNAYQTLLCRFEGLPVEKQYKLSNLVSLSAGLADRDDLSINKMADFAI